jgi:hypothetical protein
MNRLLLSLFLAVPLIPVSTMGMAQSQFDGRWTVTTIPEKGPCRRRNHYAGLRRKLAAGARRWPRSHLRIRRRAD